MQLLSLPSALALVAYAQLAVAQPQSHAGVVYGTPANSQVTAFCDVTGTIAAGCLTSFGPGIGTAVAIVNPLSHAFDVSSRAAFTETTSRAHIAYAFANTQAGVQFSLLGPYASTDYAILRFAFQSQASWQGNIADEWTTNPSASFSTFSVAVNPCASGPCPSVAHPSYGQINYYGDFGIEAFPLGGWATPQGADLRIGLEDVNGIVRYDYFVGSSVAAYGWEGDASIEQRIYGSLIGIDLYNMRDERWGEVVFADGGDGTVLMVTPEPATLTLAGTGLLLLMLGSPLRRNLKRRVGRRRILVV